MASHNYNKIEATPSAYNIISSNRSIGYSFDAAVADIIDNSLSAGASRIELFSPAGRSPVLKISDDGSGMDLDELTGAMTFGGLVNCQSDRAINDLGRFGMGLKTASLSQCKRLEVVTRKNGVTIGGCWDLDVLEEDDKWEFILLSEEECTRSISGTLLENEGLDSGTTVIWSKFDRLKASSDNQNDEFDLLLDKTVSKLELVFHRYLQGEEGLEPVKMVYNGNELEPNDPFLTKRVPLVATPISLEVNNEEVLVMPHKLLHPSKLSKDDLNRLCLGKTLLETQGFYVYRAKRLIDYGTWFGIVPKLEKTKLSRIQIDIPNTLDSEWSLDIKKSHVIPPQIIRQELRNILKKNEAKSVRTFRNRKKKDSHAYPYWFREEVQGKGGECRYLVNRDHPLISRFMDQLGDDQKKEFNVIISNLGNYFPFSLLELDYQNDIKVDPIESVDALTLANIKFLHEYAGMGREQLYEMFPGLEETVDKLCP